MKLKAIDLFIPSDEAKAGIMMALNALKASGRAKAISGLDIQDVQFADGEIIIDGEFRKGISLGGKAKLALCVGEGGNSLGIELRDLTLSNKLLNSMTTFAIKWLGGIALKDNFYAYMKGMTIWLRLDPLRELLRGKSFGGFTIEVDSKISAVEVSASGISLSLAA